MRKGLMKKNNLKLLEKKFIKEYLKDFPFISTKKKKKNWII